MMIFNYSHGESDMREKRLVGCALSFPPLHLFTILSSNFYNSLLSLALFSKQNSTTKNISRNSTTLDHHHNTNMDPSPHQNWLAFSLSNYSHQLSLFQNNPSGAVTNENESATTDHLPLLLGADGGPKLEDFLGSSGGGATGEGVAQFSDHAALVQTYDDLELKNIAASFLHGYNKNVDEGHMQLAVVAPPEPPAKKAVETYGQRTSIFRGVTRHRWTGRYEAHLWDNSCRREGQSRKGRQVYLGGYDKEEKAARAYDLAALKYWGPTTTTNFPVSDYEKEVEEMKNMTRQEFVASLRRKSSGFSRGASIYRGVTRHHQHGRWQARIGRVAGNKDLYLGTFSTQEEAAEAYDIAAIKFRGLNAVTNFDMSRYDVKSIASSNLPVGGVTNKSKTSSESQSGDNRSVDGIQSDDSSTKDLSVSSIAFPSQNSVPALNFSMPIKQDQSSSLWAAIGYQHPTLVPNDPSNMSPISQGTTPLCIEFQPSPSNCDNENIYGVGGYYQLQERGIDCTSSGSGGSVALSGTDGTNDELTYGNGNWIPQSIHPFQTTKSNLSEFQTPIFGLE